MMMHKALVNVTVGQDAIGYTILCTVDFETANDGCVTVRDRDTMHKNVSL